MVLELLQFGRYAWRREYLFAFFSTRAFFTNGKANGSVRKFKNSIEFLTNFINFVASLVAKKQIANSFPTAEVLVYMNVVSPTQYTKAFLWKFNWMSLYSKISNICAYSNGGKVCFIEQLQRFIWCSNLAKEEEKRKKNIHSKRA